MNWYYADGLQQVGPIVESELTRLAQIGTVKPSTLVWREGMVAWQPFTLAVTSPNLTADGKLTCTECNRELPVDELIRYSASRVCANCKPLFFQKLREGAQAISVVPYAGFWVRVCAKVIDWITLQVANIFAGYALGLALFSGSEPSIAVLFVPLVMAYVSHAIYDTLLIGRYGATLGKIVCGLEVTLPDGGRVSYARALGRHFAALLSGMILGIGYLMVAFDKEERRALHDRICNTRVVKRTIPPQES